MVFPGLGITFGIWCIRSLSTKGEKKEFMSYRHMTYQKDGNVMVVRINDREGKQANFDQLYDELNNFCAGITWDDTIRVVILADGEKNFFSMGSDLIGENKGIKGESPIKIRCLTEPIAKIGCPVIAVIHGDAIGEGLELALACDIRIAQEASHFGLPQIQADLIPWDGGTQRLPRLVGRGKAMEMILTGEVIDAQEAYRIGLVNKIVPADELMTVAMELAREMATKGPIALRFVKEAINKGMDLTLEQGLRLEADLYFLLHTTRDRTEGIKAFREKKKPRFEGK